MYAISVSAHLSLPIGPDANMARVLQTYHTQRALLAFSDGESPGCHNRGSLSRLLAFLFPKGVWRHAASTNVGHNSTAESGCRSSSLRETTNGMQNSYIYP